MPGGAPGKLGWQASDAGAGREPVKRTELTPKQLAALMAQFKADRLPSSETRAKLAKELGMSTRSVQIWFQNRRQRDPNRVRKPQHKPVLGRLVRPSLIVRPPPSTNSHRRAAPRFRPLMMRSHWSPTARSCASPRASPTLHLHPPPANSSRCSIRRRHSSRNGRCRINLHGRSQLRAHVLHHHSSLLPAPPHIFKRGMRHCGRKWPRPLRRQRARPLL